MAFEISGSEAAAGGAADVLKTQQGLMESYARPRTMAADLSLKETHAKAAAQSLLTQEAETEARKLKLQKMASYDQTVSERVKELGPGADAIRVADIKVKTSVEKGDADGAIAAQKQREELKTALGNSAVATHKAQEAAAAQRAYQIGEWMVDETPDNMYAMNETARADALNRVQANPDDQEAKQAYAITTGVKNRLDNLKTIGGDPKKAWQDFQQKELKAWHTNSLKASTQSQEATVNLREQMAIIEANRKQAEAERKAQESTSKLALDREKVQDAKERKQEKEDLGKEKLVQGYERQLASLEDTLHGTKGGPGIPQEIENPKSTMFNSEPAMIPNPAYEAKVKQINEIRNKIDKLSGVPPISVTYSSAQEDWITKAMEQNKMSREEVITQGKKLNKL